MASFVPPQVDHNLYTPILPQDNVQQIFSLLDQKQQMYNQGVKVAQNKISSMLGLEKDVTSDPIRNMVTDFNGKANDLIKQYANLDFSLQSNVSLIDNIYNPLLDNKLFLTDYSATKHNNSEIQKALSYRDSTDDKVRNLFNQKNLDLLNIKRQDLAGAQTEKDIKIYSSKLENTSYTPYHDYNAELMGYMKDNKEMFEMVRDTTTEDGYIVSYKNGPQRYESIKSFVESFLSDKSRTQMEIEQSVDFASSLRTSGLSKEQFLTGKITESQDQYEMDVLGRQKEVEQINTLLKSYPTENLTTKQKEQVEALNQQLQTKGALLDRSQSILNDFNSFMKRAEEGDIELSRFYDIAENLVVDNGVNNKIKELSYGLVGPESLTLKKDDVFWTRISEDRLERQLQHQIENDKEKNLLDAAGNGLVSAYFDVASGKWTFGQNAGNNGEFYDESQNTPGEVAPVDINMYNTSMEDYELKQNNHNVDATLQVIEAQSFLNDTPLNNIEVTNLKNIITTNGLNTSVSAIYEKYKNDPITLEVLVKAGITQSNSTLGDALKTLVVNAESFVKNTTSDQSGNKAGYYNTLKSSLEEYNTTSTILGVEKQVLVDAAKKDLVEFEKKYPEYVGAFKIDSRTGKLSRDPNFIDVSSVARGSANMDLQSGVDFLGLFASPKPKEGDPEAEMDFSNPESAFNSFLKTQKGALGNVGSYMQRTIASPMSAFNWLKENKQSYINNPAAYELSMEEYDKSKFKDEAGKTWGDTDETELSILNNIQTTFLRSIGDVPLTLSNKNIMGVADKVIERAGEVVVFPNRQYLKYAFQLIDKDGKPTDVKSELANEASFDGLLESVAKNGITIKTEKGKNSIGANVQAYLNSGNVLSIGKSNAGSSADFKISKSAKSNGFVVEGTFKDASDFFLQKELTYKIDKESGSVQPSSPSYSFKFFKYDLLPTQVNKSIFETTNKIADGQLYFNQQKDSPEFIGNLIAYIEARKGSTNQVSGQIILDYLNLINR